MARIPTYVSEERFSGVPSIAQTPLGSPEQFGAGVGVAQERLGQAIIGTGVAGGNLVQDYVEKQAKLDTVNAVARFDFSKDFLTMQTQAPVDPKEFGVQVRDAYTKKVDDYTNTLDVPENTRGRIKIALLGHLPTYVGQAEQYSVKVGEARDKYQSNEGLTIQQNRMLSDPSIDTYNDALKKSLDLIDAQPGTPAILKEQMKVAARKDLAQRRFQGMINAATVADDPIAFQGILNELNSGAWDDKLDDKAKEQLTTNVLAKLKSANSAEAAAGRAALTGLEQRNHDGVVINESELARAKQAVVKSNRPELMSKMAMIERQQEIYRTGKELAPDEQRANYEKAMKAKGIDGLPEPIKRGIARGVELTNGQIPATYLAGIVNGEYGNLVGTGDYGKQTTAKLPDGRPASDATGVTQFISTTWVNTLRRHATALGVDPNKSDAELLAMRKDPELSIAAAALHALDNKREAERMLGRPMSDGDLYFMHFLGMAGGIRFLQAADANPRGPSTQNVLPEQVAANRNVFFDPATGKERSNADVRMLMTSNMMNGPTRVDYAGAQAWHNVIKAREKGLNEDPMDFARTTQRFGDIGDLNTPEGVAKRATMAGQVASFYGIAVNKFKPLTKSEVEQYGKIAQDGTADDTLAVMRKLKGLGGDMATAAFKQIGEKDSLFGYAAGHPDPNVAADIIRGEKRVKLDKDVLSSMGQTETDRISTFDSYVGRSLEMTGDKTSIRKAADAIYIERGLSRGAAKSQAFNTTEYKKAIDAAMGGKLGFINGQKTVLPQTIDEPTFNNALNKATSEDYTAMSKYGNAPLYTDGKAASVRDIATEGRFEYLGAGEYRIKMADGNYLLSGFAKMADGTMRGVPYILQATPPRLREMAVRGKQSVTVPATPPPQAPAAPAPPAVMPTITADTDMIIKYRGGDMFRIKKGDTHELRNEGYVIERLP